MVIMSLVMLLRSTPLYLYQINIFRVKTKRLGYDRMCCSVYFKELYIWKLFVCDLLSTPDELTPIIHRYVYGYVSFSTKHKIFNFFSDIIDQSCYTRFVSHYLNACFSKQLTPWKQAVKKPRSVWFFVQLAQQVVNSEWYKKKMWHFNGVRRTIYQNKGITWKSKVT